MNFVNFLFTSNFDWKSNFFEVNEVIVSNNKIMDGGINFMDMLIRKGVLCGFMFLRKNGYNLPVFFGYDNKITNKVDLERVKIATEVKLIDQEYLNSLLFYQIQDKYCGRNLELFV